MRKEIVHAERMNENERKIEWFSGMRETLNLFFALAAICVVLNAARHEHVFSVNS